MRFNRKDLAQAIQPGTVFRRRGRKDHCIETASVLRVKPDPSGIPHVHFNLVYRRMDEVVADGPRVLALETFAKLYSERVTA